MTPEAFLTHSIHEKLEQFHNAYSSENALTKIDHDRRSFYSAGYNYIKNSLRISIPELIKEGELNPIWSEVESATAQINEFIGNGNDGHLQNAVNHAQSAVTKTKGLPQLVNSADYDFAKAVAEFQRTLSESYRQVEAENSRIREQLNGYALDMTNKQAQMQELERKMAEKELEMQNLISKSSADFDSFKTNLQASFDIERKRSLDLLDEDRKGNHQQHEIDKNQWIADFSALKDSFSEESKILNEQIKQVHENSLKSLNEKLVEARKIVNVIGNVGITGNYQIIANDHKKNANIWRAIAIGFMAVMSILLIWSIIELSHGKFELYRSLLRIIAAAIFTYPALYAARESSKHRNLETHNRNLELELASIGPFIEMLPDGKKETIKEELVKRYFGNSSSLSDKKEDEEVSIGAIEKLIKAITPLINKK